MPISKNRKGHAKKALARKVSEKNRKAHLENMYKSMVQELTTKYNTSVPDMLNKEEIPIVPQITTNAESEEYTTIDTPMLDLAEPVLVPFSQVIE